VDFAAVQKMAFALIGGLGIFLLGMKYMSEGLQTVAGPSLKKLIAAVTGNRYLATVIGVVVTTIVQSSSVTTVMAVGFVNSGIMGLGQAIGVILGANIGTTITGWIIALKIGKWGLPILGIATFFFLFSKKEKVKYTAFAILGIGMVFFGLEVMKGGVKVIKTIPEFEEAFTYFSASTYLGVLKCALAGCILTILVQSSSATLGITITLASQGVIGFETAAALVLGENIGTTITAYLASIGATTNAKRAAYFHMVFNVLGVVWITSIFRAYLPFIEWVNEFFFGVTNITEMKLVDGAETFPHISFAIASVHTIFNVVNVLLFLPLTKVMADLLIKFIPEKELESKHLTHLDFSHLESPFAALEMSGKEVEKMSAYSKVMMEDLRMIIQGKEEDAKLISSIFKQEEVFDRVQQEVTEFLTELLGENMSGQDVENAKTQLKLVDEYESVSDYIAQVLKLFLRLKEQEKPLNQGQRTELLSLHTLIEEFMIHSDSQNQTDTDEIEEKSQKITEEVRRLRNKHWDDLAHSKMDPLVSTTYTDILTSYRKIKNHSIQVADAHSN
jgi:phosphate:Na+ symporter